MFRKLSLALLALSLFCAPAIAADKYTVASDCTWPPMEMLGDDKKPAGFAIDYIREVHEYQSDINGTGGLDRFIDNYEGWLEKLEQDNTRIPNEEKVPARTFFLVRDTDRQIVGMINIRLCLNERLSHYGGHMGYSIRPTERGKGYNKINLYLGLKVCDAHGIDTVFMDADLNNPASWKTMEALGGTRIREYYDETYAHCMVVDYNIDVKKALREHPEFEEIICPIEDIF